MVSTPSGTPVQAMEALLEKFAVEAWREHYIDYASLNEQVEKIRTANEEGDRIRDLERDLFNGLDGQVQKLNKFSRIAQNFFTARIALLESRLAKIIENSEKEERRDAHSTRSSHSHTSQTSSTSNSQSSSPTSLSPKSLTVDIPRMNTPKTSQRQNMSSLIEETASSLHFEPAETPDLDTQLQPNLIQFDTLVCGRGLLNLEDFANINHTGFEQILDNYESVSGKSAEFYLERVEQATFYENAPYENLCSQLESINQQLRAILRRTKRLKTPQESENCARAYSVRTSEQKQSEVICLSDEEKEIEDASSSPQDGLSATYFVHSFVAASDEDNIPTSKRQNLEFWRQCRRLDGIQFQIPVPREVTSTLHTNESKPDFRSFQDKWFLFALVVVFIASTIYLMYSYM